MVYKSDLAKKDIPALSYITDDKEKAKEIVEHAHILTHKLMGNVTLQCFASYKYINLNSYYRISWYEIVCPNKIPRFDHRWSVQLITN